MALIGSLSMALATLNFGLFIRPMGDDLGISRSMFGWAQTARQTVGGLTSPVIGKIIDRIGSRVLIAIGILITGLAVGSLGFIQNQWQLIALFACMGIVATGGPANLTTTVPIAKWFIKKRGRAMALVGVGPFAGGILIVPFTQYLISSFGWRNAWIVLATLSISVIIPLSLIFIRRQPEDLGLTPDGIIQDEQLVDVLSVNVTTEISWNLNEVIHNNKFWVLVTIFSFVMFSVSSAGLHRIPNFVDKGLEPGLIALGMSLDALAGGVSIFLFGFVSERIPVRYIGSFAYILLALAIYLSVVGDTVILMFLHFIIFGMGIGGMMFINSYLWANYFGRENLGSIRGLVMPLTLISSGIGPPLAGYMRDITGTYNFIWLFGIVLLLISALTLGVTKPPIKQ
jgi:sugar phosphate permease